MAAQSSTDKAERLFRRAGGVLRTKEALRRGIHPRTLYALRDAGRLEPLGRGVYLLAGCPFSEKIDYVVIAARQPKAVVCLTSALAWHVVTTQLPHQIHIALPRGTKAPRGRYPPVKVFRFSRLSYSQGVGRYDVNGIPVRVYSLAKTVADCFKFRNQVGLDVALEALRESWRARRVTMDELTHYANVCRVGRIMRPYLESLA